LSFNFHSTFECGKFCPNTKEPLRQNLFELTNNLLHAVKNGNKIALFNPLANKYLSMSKSSPECFEPKNILLIFEFERNIQDPTIERVFSAIISSNGLCEMENMENAENSMGIGGNSEFISPRGEKLFALLMLLFVYALL
jgi:hypothetical protein